jgi:hypothetical protein
MEKQINFDGYTVAIIKKLYPNGDCLCDLRSEVDGVITKADTDIIFSEPHPFDLTEEDIEELNPPQTHATNL